MPHLLEGLPVRRERPTTWSASSDWELQLHSLSSLPFTTNDDLIRHVQSEHDGRRFWCNYEVCTENHIAYTKLANMKAHLSDIHGLNRSQCQFLYHCTQCQLRFTSKTDLQVHQAQIHGLRSNWNLDSQERSKKKEAIESFLQSFQKKPKCSICNKSFETTEEVKMHEELHSSDEANFNCLLCGKEFSTTLDLFRHVYSEHEDLPYRCGRVDCAARFDSQRKLQTHWEVGHNHIMDKRFKCEQCNYQSHLANRLEIHLLTHAEKSLNCPVEGCTYMFKHPSTLLLHVRNVHKLGNQRSAICKICGKGFKNMSALGNHEVRHGNVRPFLCESCLAAFKTRKDVRQHGRVHAKDKKTGFNEKLQQPRRALLPQVITHKEDDTGRSATT